MPRCVVSGVEFEIAETDREFYRSQAVPPPRLCPPERMRRRLAFRHGGRLHHVTCALTGKRIVSMYPPSSAFPIYDQAAWWSDAWSGFDFGLEVDFHRPFFEQVADLFARVPHIALLSTGSENSYFTNHGLNLKNCYLLFGATDDHDCLYGFFVISCRDVLDSMSVVGCELCYDGVASFDCYGCIGFTNCKSCTECTLVEDCHGCEACIACVGLRNQKYHLFNKPIGREAYAQLRAELERSRYAGLPQLFEQFESLKRESPRLFAHLYQCEDCTGDMLFNSKDCIDCFDLRASERCKHVAFSPNSVGSYDCNFTAPDGVHFSYECVSTLAGESKFNAIVWRGHEVDYSLECHSSRNLFGCVGLKQAQYCILNRQYSEADYHATRRRIVEMMDERGEWGEFFPISQSPHAYNDSMASHYFPLTKEAALSRGYRWRDDPEDAKTPASAIDPWQVDIDDDSIIERIFRCGATGKGFKVTPAELSFYRRMHLPLPRYAPDERHRTRFARRHQYQLHHRSCDVCGEALASIYSKHDAERVLCERDFLAERG